MDYAGPLWLGKISNAQFVEAMIYENVHRAFRNSNKINKLLTVIGGEAEMPPTFYVLDKLSGKLGLPAPSTATFFHRLQENGFKAVATHFNSRGIRTDASACEVGNTLRKITEP
jgi:tRNA (guanine26-N2/guanine27-N2)-dimethyltransferase